MWGAIVEPTLPVQNHICVFASVYLTQSDTWKTTWDGGVLFALRSHLEQPERSRHLDCHVALLDVCRLLNLASVADDRSSEEGPQKPVLERMWKLCQGHRSPRV